MLLCYFTTLIGYIEDLTRWREDMNFMCEWQEQYLTSERSEWVRYCSYQTKTQQEDSSYRPVYYASRKLSNVEKRHS